MPKVSVLIPVYNAASTIGGTIQSVLDQEFTDFELILCDDRSTDSSSEIIAEFKDQRIRTLSNSQNLGVSATRNRLLQEAKGTWIAFLDADDEFLPGKLSRCVREFEEIGCESLSHAMRYIMNGGRLGGYISARLIFPSGFMARTDLANSVGGFREDLMAAEDSDFFCKVKSNGPVHYIDEPLTAYGLRSNSLTDKYWFDKRLIELWYKENPDTYLPSGKGAHRQWFGEKSAAERLKLISKWYGQRCGRRAAAYYFDQKYIPAFWYAGLSLGFNPAYILGRIKSAVGHQR